MAAKFKVSGTNENMSLWTCLDHGDISLKQICTAGCLDNGKNDDSCAEQEAAQAAGDAAGDAAEGAAAARKRETGMTWIA